MCFSSRSKALSLSVDAKQFDISSSLLSCSGYWFSSLWLLWSTGHRICIQSSLHCCSPAFKSLVNQTEPLRHSQQLHKEGKTCWWYYTRYSSSKDTQRETALESRQRRYAAVVCVWLMRLPHSLLFGCRTNINRREQQERDMHLDGLSVLNSTACLYTDTDGLQRWCWWMVSTCWIDWRERATAQESI